MKRFPFWRRKERRDISSAEFEAAVNKVISADTVADATRDIYITEEGALNFTAVWACVRILSETVGHCRSNFTGARNAAANGSTGISATGWCKSPTATPHASI